MADDTDSSGTGRTGEFEHQAERAAKTSTGPAGEFLYFLPFLPLTRKFWMPPVMAALLLASLTVVEGGTAVAPRICAPF